MQKEAKKHKKSFRRFTKNEISKEYFESNFRLHPDKKINEDLQKIVEENNHAVHERFKTELSKRNIFID